MKKTVAPIDIPKKKNDLSTRSASKETNEEEELLSETLEEGETPRFHTDVEILENEELPPNSLPDRDSRGRFMSAPILCTTPPPNSLKHSNSFQKLFSFTTLKKKNSGGLSPGSPSKQELSLTISQRKHAITGDMPSSPNNLLRERKLERENEFTIMTHKMNEVL
jgi:hypothetical protein